MKNLFSWGAALRDGDFGAIADWFIFYFFVIGAVLMILSGLAVGAEHGPAAGLRVFLLSSLFAAGCTVSGWLLGLLFGVPRSLARGQIASAAPRPGGSESEQAQPRASASSRVNTNLEDISDWLTKTIVGVGLTQLFSLPGFFWNVANELNVHGFGWQPHGRLLALGLFFYFAPGGFWLGYVGTRTILTKLFDLIDTPAIEVVTVAKKDPSSDRLNSFIRPDGIEQSENEENLDKLREWIATHIPGTRVGTFLNSPAFAEQRTKAVADLKVP